MNKIFTFFLIALLASASLKVNGQTGIIRGIPQDSTVYLFPVNNPLTPINTNVYLRATIDTTDSHLWQIGETNKTFFADSGAVRGIITDTSQYYPDSANNYFTLKIPASATINPIVSFTHKYQTSAGKDGCIIEFSKDNKVTWQNIAGDCLDTNNWQGIHVENVYDKKDTLLTGEPAFSGSSNGWQLSQIQFFSGAVLRTTGTVNCTFFNDIYIRFRFVSDTISDSLDGWIIGNIKVNYDHFDGGVNEVKKLGALKIFPNPVTADVLYFPELPNADRLTISVYDVMGKKCLQLPYQHTLNVQKLPAGVYSYRVNDDERQYSGRIVIAK